MTNPVQKFWYLLTQLGKKEEYLTVLNPYGVTSISHLSAQKQEELTTALQTEWKTRSKRPRGAVIHYLCTMPNYSFKTAAGEPDYEKIDEWVKRKMKDKALNQLTLSELNTAVKMVKGWYAKEIKTKP